MKLFFGLLTILCGGAAVSVMVATQSAVHEIEAGILLLICATSGIGFMLAEELARRRKEERDAKPPAAKPATASKLPPQVAADVFRKKP